MGEKVKHELRELIPVTLFFFATFQLLALTDALILRQYGIHPATFFAATMLFTQFGSLKVTTMVEKRDWISPSPPAKTVMYF